MPTRSKHHSGPEPATASRPKLSNSPANTGHHSSRPRQSGHSHHSNRPAPPEPVVGKWPEAETTLSITDPPRSGRARILKGAVVVVAMVAAFIAGSVTLQRSSPEAAVLPQAVGPVHAPSQIASQPPAANPSLEPSILLPLTAEEPAPEADNLLNAEEQIAQITGEVIPLGDPVGPPIEPFVTGPVYPDPIIAPVPIAEPEPAVQAEEPAKEGLFSGVTPPAASSPSNEPEIPEGVQEKTPQQSPSKVPEHKPQGERPGNSDVETDVQNQPGPGNTGSVTGGGQSPNSTHGLSPSDEGYVCIIC